MDEALAPAVDLAAARNFRGLDYPFSRAVPGPGELTEVAEGVHWLRMPLPFSPRHINLYVLEDGDGWTIVDAGLRWGETLALWERLLAGPLAGRPVKRVLVTHFHPDHLGLAGWLCAHTGADLWMSRSNYLLASMLIFGAQAEPPEAALDFYRRAGWGEEDLAVFRERGWSGFARAVHGLPASFRRVQAGDMLRIGRHAWRVVVGEGHAPEHLCLVCEDLGVMIAGDQVLPRISPNVSVTLMEPEGNPLRDWLESIEALRALRPELLVLPAHGEPFFGLHERLDQLAGEHALKLEKLLAHCAVPRTVVECFEALFQKLITVSDIMSATGEALAHLNYLKYCGRMETRPKGGMAVYVAC